MSEPQPRPTNLTFVEIPLSETPRETDERSFMLRPSPIAGVGVFITHPVKKGTYLALFLDDTIRRIPYSEMKKDAQLEAFCLVYGVEREDYCCVPHSFSKMEVGWFLNHSKTPNAGRDDGWRAIRDIAAGEEITIDYTDC
jgi:SET domain-containing protein